MTDLFLSFFQPLSTMPKLERWRKREKEGEKEEGRDGKKELTERMGNEPLVLGRFSVMQRVR